jgi:hypothetical protein
MPDHLEQSVVTPECPAQAERLKIAVELGYDVERVADSISS